MERRHQTRVAVKATEFVAEEQGNVMVQDECPQRLDRRLPIEEGEAQEELSQERHEVEVAGELMSIILSQYLYPNQLLVLSCVTTKD